MKKFKKLIPAMVMLLIATMLMGTTTYAWFSMNNKVTVTGMEVRTKVSSNLLVADDDAGATAKKADSEFKSVLTDTVKGILEPVSTANAEAFFYTIDAKADGDRTNSSAVIYQYDSSAVAVNSAAYADLFSERYGVTKSAATTTYDERAVAYVDYVFQLKATNTSGSDQYIVVNKVDLTYAKDASTDADDSNTAYRVAFFIEDITTKDTSAASATGVKSQLKVASSANFEGKVLNDALGGTANAPYLTSNTALTSVASDGKAHYYKVTVRMWLEGQDTTCNNTTFMALTGKWSLDLELALVSEATEGVHEITMKP